MSTFKSWVFFQIFIITHLIFVTIAQPDLWYQLCDGNSTAKSPFQSNLDDVLYDLTKTNNGYGFFNKSSGHSNDTVNAVALCRGDSNPDNCSRCVDDASRKLREECPYQTEATGWYDKCLLNYSNKTLLHNTTINIGKFICFVNKTGVTNWPQFNHTMVGLFVELNEEAARGGSLRKYATGERRVTDSLTIYGMVQCTPDLSESQCEECLGDAVGNVQNCATARVGGRVYQPTCTLRYELFSFYDKPWLPTSPLPSSPSSPVRSDADRKSKIIKAIFIGIASTAGAAGALMMAVSVFCNWRNQHHVEIKQKGEDMSINTTRSIYVDEDNKNHKYEDDTLEMHHFSLSTIRDATNDFSDENKLGEGGFGPVYKGKLGDGTEIAVKRLSKNSSQGLEEFKTEVQLIIKLQHKNLVRLLGSCIKGDERLLVYEYMINTSLDSFLFDPTKSKELNWGKRAKIVCGIAKGLRYLHEDSRLKIVHRDMKASNVLLDDAMDPKISDFGTARIFGVDQIDANTNIVVGTYGYMAPEYAMEGLFSIKSDVYSFGVLLLEIIYGRRNNGFYFQEHDQTLLSYAWRMWKEGKGEELIDKTLINDCPIIKALRWIHIALLCVQEDPKDRPIMSSIVFMLEGQWSTLPDPLEPPLSFSKLLISDESSTCSDKLRFLSTSQSLQVIQTR